MKVYFAHFMSDSTDTNSYKGVNSDESALQTAG